MGMTPLPVPTCVCGAASQARPAVASLPSACRGAAVGNVPRPGPHARQAQRPAKVHHGGGSGPRPRPRCNACPPKRAGQHGHAPSCACAVHGHVGLCACACWRCMDAPARARTAVTHTKKPTMGVQPALPLACLGEWRRPSHSQCTYMPHTDSPWAYGLHRRRPSQA